MSSAAFLDGLSPGSFGVHLLRAKNNQSRLHFVRHVRRSIRDYVHTREIPALPGLRFQPIHQIDPDIMDIEAGQPCLRPVVRRWAWWRTSTGCHPHRGRLHVRPSVAAHPRRFQWAHRVGRSQLECSGRRYRGCSLRLSAPNLYRSSAQPAALLTAGRDWEPPDPTPAASIHPRRCPWRLRRPKGRTYSGSVHAFTARLSIGILAGMISKELSPPSQSA